MKKFIIYIISLTFIILWAYQTTNALWVVDINTFILNAWNDLWKVIPKWTYYIPQIEYTDSEAIQKQLSDNLSYPWDFYTSRNITQDLINNKSPYFTVSWERPYFVKSLSWIKRVLKWYLFAYRVQWKEIFWMDAKNFTEAFLAWYKTPEDQSIIIYPIKNNQTNKIVAFIQYPCWNLVCKDTMCSDLKITPVCWDGVVNKEIWEVCDPKDPNTRKGCTNTCQYEQLSCKIYNSKEIIDNTQNPYVKVSKDYNVDIKKYYLNKQEFDSYKDINKLDLEPWKYVLNAVWINEYSNQEFLCESDSFIVENKEYCWDGVVSGAEECDYNDTDNNWTCTRTCKFSWDSCSIKTTWLTFDEPINLAEVLDVKKSEWTLITKIEVNGENVSNSSTIIKEEWDYNIEVFIKNTYSWKTTSCSKTIKYDPKEYCWDGIITWYEQCDDSNTESWDGCSNTCRLETPTCKINKTGYSFDKGLKFSEYINLTYEWNFKSWIVNKTDVYNTENSLLSSAVPKSICWDKWYFQYTVYNPIDTSITKTCDITYRTNNREYCWDGIVSKDEQCDPEDPYSGEFCSNTCKFKTTKTCNVLNNAFIQWEESAIVIDTEYFAIPSKLAIDWRTISSKNGVFSYTFKEPWNYDVTAMLSNKVDKRNVNPSYCDFTIKVLPNQCEE